MWGLREVLILDLDQCFSVFDLGIPSLLEIIKDPKKLLFTKVISIDIYSIRIFKNVLFHLKRTIINLPYVNMQNFFKWKITIFPKQEKTLKRILILFIVLQISLVSGLIENTWILISALHLICCRVSYFGLNIWGKSGLKHIRC